MKKKLNLLSLFTLLLFIIFGVGFVNESAQATVGGPSYIYDFKYNSKDESVYYTLISEGGRGCPPMLYKISLNTSKIDVVFSCDDGEKLLGSNYNNIQLITERINKITDSLKNLIPLDLKKNQISVDINFLSEEKLSPDDYVIKRNFTASVFQNNKKVADLSLGGCNIEQPFVFAGYAIPGFEKKIILLLSTKGDCWEGGYLSESLHVVGGVENLDKTYLSNFYKTPSALVPNEGTLVVFELDEANNKVDNPTNSNTNIVDRNTNVISVEIPKMNSSIVVVAIVSLLVGITFGKFFLNKKKVLK